MRLVVVITLYLEFKLFFKAIEQFGRRAASGYVHARRAVCQGNADAALRRASEVILLTRGKEDAHQEYIYKCLYLFHSIGYSFIRKLIPFRQAKAYCRHLLHNNRPTCWQRRR